MSGKGSPRRLLIAQVRKLLELWRKPVQKLPHKLQALLRKLHLNKQVKPPPLWRKPLQKLPPLLLPVRPLRTLKPLPN